jgi:hypothetical protein
MRSVFVYRWIELSQWDTWYGTMTRYETALSRKKGYEEAVIDGLVFCTYALGPLLLYTDNTREAAFEMAGEKRVCSIREKAVNGELRDGLIQYGINCTVAKRELRSREKEAGIMANPANMERFHFLRISLHKGKDDQLYEYDRGYWRYGAGDVYRQLEKEYRAWGSLWLGAGFSEETAKRRRQAK